MSGYLLSIIGVVLLSAILTSILPDGKTSGLIKSVMRMVCILAIIAPIFNFFRSGTLSLGENENSEMIFYETGIEIQSSFINYYSEMRIEETENALENELLEKYQTLAEVSLTWDIKEERLNKKYVFDAIHITQMHVKTMEQKDEEVLRNMWEYLTKNYCSEVLIE